MSCAPLPAPSAWILALAIATGCATQVSVQREAREDPGGEPDVARAADPGSEPLPPWLRPIVRTQMARQWDYVSELRWTAASLEFDRTSELARRIVQEVPCGRPADANAPVDAVVPARYLEMQERLRQQAYRLSLVASSGNTRVVSAAYHSMVEVCTRCHDVYRPGPPLALPIIGER